MLVYCSLLKLAPKNGFEQIFGTVARWIGEKTKTFIDPFALRGERYHLRLRDGSVIDAVSSLEGSFLLSAVTFTHRDDIVSGRQWTSEIGMKGEAAGGVIDCTILLKTSEVSARVTAPIQVTRPRIVEYLVRECLPTDETAGLRVIKLDEDSAPLFCDEVDNEHRVSPYVVVSPTADYQYIVEPSRLSSLLVGIAEVVAIPKDADTFKIESVVGEKYSAYRGAINVLFAPRKVGGTSSVYCVRLLPDKLLSSYDEGMSPDSEVLSVVTHRTNLPHSWRHISPEAVEQHRLRHALSASLAKARASRLSQQEYIDLLQIAESELQLKDKELKALQDDLEDKDTELRRSEHDVDSLKYALNAREAAVEGESRLSLDFLRKAIDALQQERPSPSLEQSLELVSSLYPDRIMVLESAYASAKQASNFRHKLKAFHLVWKLANGYWEAMQKGGGDSHAKSIFGDAFAAREAETLSKQGLKRRTFVYKGAPIEMLKHLRIGVKESASETLRVHFHWDAKDQRLVIGHCGKHLDF